MYNYLENVIEDVKQAILDNYTAEEIRGNLTDRDEWEERLNDDLWTDDSVTGNASGSYTFSTWAAEEYLTHNWGILAEALDEFGDYNINPIERGAEWCDVTIRCYLLRKAISEVLDELEEEFPEEDEDEEEEE